MEKIKGLLKYAAPYKKKYLVGIFFLILVDFIQLVPPKILGYLTDGLSQGSATKGSLIKAIIYILIIALVMAFGRFMWRIYVNGTSRQVEYDIRSKFFKHLQGLSANFYNEKKTGDLMALATNDLNAVRMALGPGVIMFFDAVVLTIATICIMLTINVQLTILALLPLPFVAIVSQRFGKKIHKKFTKVQSCFSKLTDVVQENFSGIRIVKSFVQEEKEYEKFMEENDKNFQANMDFIRIWGVFSPLVEFISSLSFALLIIVGGTFVVLGKISLGDFVTFNMYLGNLVWPMMAIGWVINILQRGFASIERIEEILHTKADIVDKNTELLESLNGDIVIKDLTFTYENVLSPTLKNINLRIKKGETLGIVGRTGSSKSTLVSLFLRLYNVVDGKIFIGDKDINRISLNSLRKNIGFVSQDPFLFSTTLSENIGLAFDKIDEDKVKDATIKADIYDNIKEFPLGFETIVGERGTTLSGGQKQRSSIARALIKDPDILILDDCLSAVDAKTEVKILENLKQVMKDKTSIIISHRISAVKDAHNIIVLEDGEIVEQGTHEELKNIPGIYKDIFEKQQIEQEIMEEEEV
ncbi:MAG: ABC transporter ATP-binding protein [Clostridium sp.]|uniref:ABC transporter ATP-binding protein n=1 Tax=Clostridium sp. TaxID=1506 RepID=UPI0030725C06